MATSYKKNLLLLTFFCSPIFVFSFTLTNLSPKQTRRSRALEILEINKYNKKISSNLNNLPMMKSQILYLLSKGEQVKGIQKYKEYAAKTGNHDYRLLREMSLMIIDNGVTKGTESDILLSLIAMEISNEDSFTHHLRGLMQSNYFSVQAKTLSLLKRIDNDYSDLLIKSCLSSNFIMLRLEALSILVQKHNKTALGQVEALMNMVQKRYHPIFVNFYAMAGTKYAISKMKQMLSDQNIYLNLATIHAIKDFNLEELIPNLRNSLTHTSPIIQEIAAYTIGSFSDAHSITKLEALCTSKHEETKLAALYALYLLGQKTRSSEILSLARGGNLYAISLLSKLEGMEKPLHEIYYSDDNELRINSAAALLELHDPLCLPLVKDIITLDSNIYYIDVNHSPGRAFTCLKVKALSSVANKELATQLKHQTLMAQNNLLVKCLELPRKKFMTIIDDIFVKKENSLVGAAVALLENFDDEEARNYLREKSVAPGAPFIRTSCHLSLWKSTKLECHKNAISSWLKEHGKHEMLKITQNTSKNKKKLSVTGYELSLEERSHLLIQAFLHISASHDKAGLDCILDAMISGHEKNRIPLAGVLLKTIQ